MTWGKGKGAADLSNYTLDANGFLARRKRQPNAHVSLSLKIDFSCIMQASIELPAHYTTLLLKIDID
jgi:hypothetical protein